jgi:hypothetical protein
MMNQVRLALHSRDPRTRTVGKLCVGGDWACANGDLGTLGDIASRLVTCVPEPLRCELSNLSEMCRKHPDEATSAWVQIKRRVLQTVTRSS